MKKSHKLIACCLALCGILSSSAAYAERKHVSPAKPVHSTERAADQAGDEDKEGAKKTTGNDSKISTQGLKRAQRAEANIKLLEKQQAENRAREAARAKHKDKCKGCPESDVYDQSRMFK